MNTNKTNLIIDENLVDKLSKGKVILEHTKKEEDLSNLSLILEIAFPHRKDASIRGTRKYYRASIINFNDSPYSSFISFDNVINPSVSVIPLKDFFKQKEKKVAYYSIKDNKYIKAVKAILGLKRASINTIFPNTNACKILNDFDVLELWYEPVYDLKEEQKIINTLYSNPAGKRVLKQELKKLGEYLKHLHTGYVDLNESIDDYIKDSKL